MSRPRLLDLYCAAGGAAMGYSRAGFDVVGVDHNKQPHYPFEFVLADCLELDANWLRSFDAIHASPPCQAYTTMSAKHRGKGGKADQHPDMIAPTRKALKQTGLPYVIENVPGAKREMRDCVVLNGGMFGLGVDRPRLFETNWLLMVPDKVRVPHSVGVYGNAPDGRLLWQRADGSQQRAAKGLQEGADAMEIDWMEWSELRLAIPPAYTELIGTQLLAHLAAAAA